MKLIDAVALYRERKETLSQLETELTAMLKFDERELAQAVYDLLEKDVQRVVRVPGIADKEHYRLYRDDMVETLHALVNGEFSLKKYEVGDRVKIVKTLGLQRGRGASYYYHGGYCDNPDHVPLQSVGLVKGNREFKVVVIFDNCKMAGQGWWHCHPDELVFLLSSETNQMIQAKGIEQYLDDKEQQAGRGSGKDAARQELLRKSIAEMEEIDYSRREMVAVLGKYFSPEELQQQVGGDDGHS